MSIRCASCTKKFNLIFMYLSKSNVSTNPRVPTNPTLPYSSYRDKMDDSYVHLVVDKVTIYMNRCMCHDICDVVDGASIASKYYEPLIAKLFNSA